MNDLYTLLITHGTWQLVVFLAVVLLLSWRFAPAGRQRPAALAILLTVIHEFLVYGLPDDPAHPIPAEAVFAIDLTAGAAWVISAAHLLFDIALARMRVFRPVIVRDLTIIGCVGFCAIFAAGHAGFALSGVIATSAVLTAVIGLSLQDTLGNVIGGISLQLDQSLAVGDWIRVGDLKGRVVQIGWRCTTIETNDWETILLPNSVLMRGSVVILARRAGGARLWRRAVKFNVALHATPAQIIGIVQAALATADIQQVAADPAPSCICTGIDHGSGAYSLRYWLNDPLHDDSTDSRVRSVVIASLAREGLAVTAPFTAVALHRADPMAGQDVEPAGDHEATHREALLAGIPLFAGMTTAERSFTAKSLTPWPVAAGERLIRAGDAGDNLFIIARGKFNVEISGDHQTINVARLGRGVIIGEMSLLTGTARTATVTAVTDALCYRLDHATVVTLTSERPELLEQLGRMLAERAESNQDAQRRASQHHGSNEESGHGTRLLKRMRAWLKPGKAEAVPTSAPGAAVATTMGVFSADQALEFTGKRAHAAAGNEPAQPHDS
jgi:small-conductance mechanosensitive channel/CRP-like cAMP-binding protein